MVKLDGQCCGRAIDRNMLWTLSGDHDVMNRIQRVVLTVVAAVLSV